MPTGKSSGNSQVSDKCAGKIRLRLRRAMRDTLRSAKRCSTCNWGRGFFFGIAVSKYLSAIVLYRSPLHT